MRFVPAYCLRPGQELGRNLIFYDNRMMLRKGIILTKSLIQKIIFLGYQGVYIKDDLSEDIEIVNVISDELKFTAQKGIRSLFETLESNANRNVDSRMNSLGGVIKDIVDEILHSRRVMVNVADIRAYDDYTFSHSVNVAVLSVVLGAMLGMDKASLNELAMGALVHDIGKVFIDKKIITKAEKLTSEEYEFVKRHSLEGYNYLRTNDMIGERAKAAVLTHHEQFNGGGYPNTISGKEIPLFGRIVSVTDVYDALVSDRPYRRAMLPSDALEYIMSGYNVLFDPAIVDAFIRKVAPYPVGTCVQLNTGIQGIVVENYEAYCLRPKVRIIEDGKPTDAHINLAYDQSALNMTISGIVNL